jgi:NAD(P)-dependent dehydrogenase (short-subunit alcohol dehydrogenase family)
MASPREVVVVTDGSAAVAPTSAWSRADADQIEAAAARIEEELGPIDVWVNNAMATRFAPVMATTPEELRRATDVPYFGSVWGTMAALRRMVPRDRGVIVQVGSALAYRGIPLQAAHCGSKQRSGASSNRCGRSSCTTGRAYG